ncbi:MAG: ferrous iron transport protein A [Firmicutes bacterium]|jgi:Fe2+ transport system protein FeoA|nr:ferrous iron transport protein A [Bacillota bacterium]
MESRRKPPQCYLNNMNDGAQGRIIKIAATGATRHRIFSLGLVEGSTVIFRDKNPLTKSIRVVIRGRSLELAEELAQEIVVEVNS